MSMCCASASEPPEARRSSVFRARSTVAPTLPSAIRGRGARTAANTTLEIACAALVPTFHTRRVIKDATKGGGTLAPGWYPSPHHRRRHRYWDGEKWTVGA